MAKKSLADLCDCSLNDRLSIVKGTPGDYDCLAGYHYCGQKLNAHKSIFTLVDNGPGKVSTVRNGIAGVIVYSMPVANLRLRNIATDGYFTGLGSMSMQLDLINENIRCISRVIIEPRYRGIGLGAKLVRETMGLLNVPIIEAMAIMGGINPFFEKAGMTAYQNGPDVKSQILIKSLYSVGIPEDLFIDPQEVHRKIESLNCADKQFIEISFKRFLSAYVKRSTMKHSLKRTRYILSKLSTRPVYYIWLNETL